MKWSNAWRSAAVVCAFGTYTDKTGGGLEATWTQVMDASVEKLVEDIVFDANLIEALNTPP